MKGLTAIRAFAVGMITAVCLATSASAASDYFLKIDGIDGESTDEFHRGSIDVQGFSYDISPPTRRPGAPVLRVSFSDLTVTKELDKSSPKLMEACAMGKHIPQAILTCRKSGGGGQETYLRITMTDVLVSSFSSTGSSSSDRPSESFSLNFTKIEFSFFFPSPTGGDPVEVKASYDIKKNVKV